MDLSKINTTVLREMLKLSERKEILLNELKKLEEQIASHLSGSFKSISQSTPKLKKAGRPSKSVAKKDRQRAVRGTMKQQIFAALTEAGSAGMKVPDLAQKIGAKNANVHVWFSNTGKKLPEIERLSAGHFRLRQNS